jgi:hypothetical protein
MLDSIVSVMLRGMILPRSISERISETLRREKRSSG